MDRFGLARSAPSLDVLVVDDIMRTFSRPDIASVREVGIHVIGLYDGSTGMGRDYLARPWGGRGAPGHHAARRIGGPHRAMSSAPGRREQGPGATGVGVGARRAQRSKGPTRPGDRHGPRSAAARACRNHRGRRSSTWRKGPRTFDRSRRGGACAGLAAASLVRYRA